MIFKSRLDELNFAFNCRYNATIGILVIVIIVVNILATAFGGPGDECNLPTVDMEEGSGLSG